MEDNFTDEPIQFITIKEEGNVELTFDGINFLNSLRGEKLAILCITGPCVSGKSLLGNFFIDQVLAFQVNPSKKDGTKGLWVWGRPIPLENNVKLLVIDTEGLKFSEKDKTQDMKVFVLSLLVSTCMIYNTQYPIDESRINELSFLSTFFDKISIHSINEEKNPLKVYAEYLPDLIWVVRDFELNNAETTSQEYLETCLEQFDKGKYAVKQHFPSLSCVVLSPPTNIEFLDQINDLILNVKSKIKPKIIATTTIGGEELFGLLQNYIESMNNDENPVILSSLENVLLSKAKNVSEKHYENFKTEFNNKLEMKFPMNFFDIYKIFFEVHDEIIQNFASEVDGTLTALQLGEYVVKLSNNMRDELEVVMETNKAFYDEWLAQEHDDLKRTLTLPDLIKLEDAKGYLFNFSSQLENGMANFLEVPNSDFCKNLLSVLLNVLHDQICENLRKLGTTISDIYSSITLNTQNTYDSFNATIKRLQEQIAHEKKIIDEKTKEKSELNRNILELESKNEKLSREYKTKEKEYTNNLSIEAQKYQKMENYYINLVKEKENTIVCLENKIEELNQERSEMGKENINKINELTQSSLKLQAELEKAKGHEKKVKTEVMDYRNSNLQSLFKMIQNIFMEFKESVDKLDRERGNIFKTRFFEVSTKEIETRSRSWTEEIRMFREDQIRLITENYESSVARAKEEIDDLNFELTKRAYTMNEEIQSKESYKSKYEEAKKETQEYINISNYKDSIISTQKDAIKLYEDKISEYKKLKEDLEINLNQNIVNYKMKEDELDTLLMVIEGLLRKKKDKFDHNIIRLSPETRSMVQSLMKDYKIFK